MLRKNQNEYPMLQALEKKKQKGRFSFHVPAHTVLPGEYWARYDLTELPGLDQLYSPKGCIAEAQQAAARVFGADKTYFLVNGSTAGLAAAIFALSGPGKEILLARNCHRSVGAGLIFSGAKPVFIPVGETPQGIPLNISAGAAAEGLSKCPASPVAVVATSPNYWGICADIGKLSSAARSVGAALLVDEAHGGHFSFHPSFPPSAGASNAHIWVNSAHKTLGALTPGAYLHVGKAGGVDRSRLEEALTLLQTSSPPYPVMLSLDLVRGWLEEKGEEMYGAALEQGSRLRTAINSLRTFHCLSQEDLPEGYDLDPLRLTVHWDKLSISGFQLNSLLHHRYGIDVELAGRNYITALLHPGLNQEAAQELLRALTEVEEAYSSTRSISLPPPYPVPRAIFTPREGATAKGRLVALDDAVGLISAQMVTPFPPGVPVLFPGEEITEALVDRLKLDFRDGIYFQDIPGENLIKIMSE